MNKLKTIEGILLLQNRFNDSHNSTFSSNSQLDEFLIIGESILR